MDIVIGTAGHIDHGKTALVRALTGTDADRLPEEKQRGITIDLGFAELDLGGVHAAFVDVPGHERFVKNMLAGAGGIDAVLLVVAADEGVMPQTREHFSICRLLGVSTGIIALTKSDLADAETLELAQLDVAELVADSFLHGAPLIAVSSVSGAGIEELKAAISTLAGAIPQRTSDRIAILPIDRSFTVKGHGAVATGTLNSGRIGTDSDLELLPQAKTVRVRSIQSHGRDTTLATAGRRVAVNLGGVDHTEISRGMLLAERGVLRPTQIADASVEVLADAPRPLRSRQRVRVHIGTAEILARIAVIDGEIAPGDSGFVQLRFEVPAVCVLGDRFIIRSYSPQTTIAGGTVLDPLAARSRRRDASATIKRLTRLVETSAAETVSVLVADAGETGLPVASLRARTGWTDTFTNDAAASAAEQIAVVGETLIASSKLEELRRRTVAAVEAYHKADPLGKGISREALRATVSRSSPEEIHRAVLESLVVKGVLDISGDTVSIRSRSRQFSPAEEKARAFILNSLVSSGLEVPKIADLLGETSKAHLLELAHVRKLLQTLVDDGEIVKISDEFYYARKSIDGLVEKLRTFVVAHAGAFDVGQFKTVAGVSRKYAIPLLEYLDREKVTLRVGEKRVIR